MSYGRIVLEEVAALDPSAMLHDPTEHTITGSIVYMAKEALKTVNDEKKAYDEAVDFMLTLSPDKGIEFMELWRSKEWDSIIEHYPNYDIDTAWPLGYCQRGKANAQ